MNKLFYKNDIVSLKKTSSMNKILNNYIEAIMLNWETV